MVEWRELKANPMVWESFRTLSLPQGSRWAIQKGATFVYQGEEVDVATRVVVYDGDPDETGVAELYKEFREEIARTG